MYYSLKIMDRSFDAALLACRATSLVAFILMPIDCWSEPVCKSDAPSHFTRIQLDKDFRSEGVATGDFNRDGKADVAAGAVWYAAPNWGMHSFGGQIRAFDPLNYSDSFANFSDDINRDGWDDLIVVGRPGEETVWYENPKQREVPWAVHLIAPVSNNESPQFKDMNNDRVRELLMAIAPSIETADGPNRQMVILSRSRDASAQWLISAISTKGASGTTKYSHGLGAGDINGDGRMDVVVAEGWWEAPADTKITPWTFHSIPFGKAVADMVVADFDGDGRADIACSSAHEIGIWWLQQLADGNWRIHQIDGSFSQSHCLRLADINGDGQLDLVTGKRWWAHGPTGDVEPNHPAVLYWFELATSENGPKWTAHLIDDNSGIGTQFEVADVNDDGLLDIAIANKKGVFLFVQSGRK